MTIFKGESGRNFRVNAGLDLSFYTELGINFTSPSGVLYEKTTADGVTLGSSAVTDNELGALAANEYVEYNVESGLFSEAGSWCVQLKYVNTSAEPDDVLYGDIGRFLVKERC